MISERFITYFCERMGWGTPPDEYTTQALTEFAEEHAGSSEDFAAMFVTFCVAYGFKPFQMTDRSALGESA